MPATTFGLRSLFGAKTPLVLGGTVPEKGFVVHRSGGFPALARIPELASVSALLDAWDGVQTLIAWSVVGSSPRELRPTRGQAAALYHAGFNMLLQGLDRLLPSVARLCRALEAEIELPAGAIYAKAFFAVAGAGAWPHFDANVTINCQVRGTKTWWLADNPAVRLPPTNMALRLPVPPEIAPLLTAPMPKHMPDTAQEVLARPGTTVFLPPGTLHATRVETDSMAILFAMNPIMPADRIASIVRKRLQRHPIARAPRFSPFCAAGSSDHRSDHRMMAAELRRVADELERC